MKKIFRNALLCGGLLAAVTACNSGDTIAPLEVMVQANSPESRAIVEGQVLPNNSSIGVTMVEDLADASSYDESVYSNIEYTTADGREWNVVGTDIPMLTSTPGKAIAYFPYKSGMNYTAIPVEILSQTDYMYSGWYSGLDNSNPEAKFQMKHALSAFRVILLKDASYGATARVTKFVIESDAYNTSAKLNAVTGELTGKDGTGSYTYNYVDGYPELTTTEQYVDVMVIPADAAGTHAKFTVTIQDINGTSKDYVVNSPFTAAMLSGTCYEFTLTLFPTEMKVSDVSVKTWDVVYGGEGQLQPADLPKN